MYSEDVDPSWVIFTSTFWIYLVCTGDWGQDMNLRYHFLIFFTLSYLRMSIALHFSNILVMSCYYKHCMKKKTKIQGVKNFNPFQTTSFPEKLGLHSLISWFVRGFQSSKILVSYLFCWFTQIFKKNQHISMKNYKKFLKFLLNYHFWILILLNSRLTFFKNMKSHWNDTHYCPLPPCKKSKIFND